MNMTYDEIVEELLTIRGIKRQMVTRLIMSMMALVVVILGIGASQGPVPIEHRLSDFRATDR